MPSIDWYLDRAKERVKIPSDNALSRRLGYANQAVNHWRLKRAWPSDGSMIALAELAGADAERALIDLNSWRAKDERARAAYLSLAAKVFSIVALGFININNAQAQSLHENNLAGAVPALYIMRYLGSDLSPGPGPNLLSFQHSPWRTRKPPL